MNKNFVSFLLLFLLSVNVAFASLSYSVKLPPAGVSPDSIFYSLDIFAEKVVLFFTFDPTKKIDKALEYAREKLSEIKAMNQENNIQAASKAIKNYKDYLDLAIKEAQETEKKQDEISKEVVEYQKVLLEVYRDISSDVRDKIREAVLFSQSRFEKISETIPLENKQELKKDQEEINFLIGENYGETEEVENNEANKRDSEESNENEVIPESVDFSTEERSFLEKCKETEYSTIFEIIKCYQELGLKFKNLDLCSQTEEISGLGACYGGVAGAANDEEICGSQSKSFSSSKGAYTMFGGSCYASLAQSLKNAGICKEAPNSESVIGCHLLLAGLEEDVKICDNIGAGRESCFIVVAIKKNDLSICNQVENPNWKNLCFSTFQNEIEGKSELCKNGEQLGLFSEEDCLKYLGAK